MVAPGERDDDDPTRARELLRALLVPAVGIVAAAWGSTFLSSLTRARTRCHVLAHVGEWRLAHGRRDEARAAFEAAVAAGAFISPMHGWSVQRLRALDATPVSDASSSPS